MVSQGVDIQLSGATSFGLQLNGSYTYQNSEYAKGEDRGEGFNTSIPEHVLSLGGTYSLPGDKWTLGAQTRVQSKQYNEGTRSGIDYQIEQGTVALLDLMLQYRISDSSIVKLNINNLFDREYYERVFLTTSANHYGEPRSFFLTYRLSFQ